jgi:hypothetical protein
MYPVTRDLLDREIVPGCVEAVVVYLMLYVDSNSRACVNADIGR